MQFSPAEESEFLEQENSRMNMELAAHSVEEVPVATTPAKFKPVAEVSKIIEMKDQISAYMSPELEADLKAVAASAQVIVKVTTKDEREAAQTHATACQKARTQKVEKPHEAFKAPVTAVGRLFDGRKTTLSSIVKVEEDRVRGLIAGFDKIEAERIAEDERLRKAKISQRINELASKGIAVDTEFAEVADDGEWALHVEKEIAAKEQADLAEKEKQARAEAAQKRLLNRFEIASKLGAVISKDDAELLDEAAFEEMRDKWVVAFNIREADATWAREVADLVARASAAGLMLPMEDFDKMREEVNAGQAQDIEAAFMIWIGDATQAKKLADEKAAAATRMAARMEEAEALGLVVAISAIKAATDEEWAVLVEAAKPAPVVATPAPKIPDHASIVMPVRQMTKEEIAEKFDPAPQGETCAKFVEVQGFLGAPHYELRDVPVEEMRPASLSDLEKALSDERDAIREELGVVFQAFKDFGNKHCRRTDLNAGYYQPVIGTEFRELYAKLKLLVERV